MACSSTQLGVKVEGTDLCGGGGADLFVAFTSVGRTCTTSIVACARRWIWRSQCLRKPLLQVVYDNILVVVDVLLIGSIMGGSTHCEKSQFSGWVEYYKR
jgi:hypothetical protein